MENKETNKAQLIVRQEVSIRLSEQYARILLNINDLVTKEEMLLGLIMECVDSEGMVEIIPASRDKLCSIVGTTNGMWRLYLTKWRQAGIITTSGRWICFKNFITKDTQGLLLCKPTNGME